MSRLFTGFAIALTVTGAAAGMAIAQDVSPALAQKLLGFSRPAITAVALPPERSSPTYCTAAEKAAHAAALQTQLAQSNTSFAAARAYVEKLDARYKELQADPDKNAMALDLARTEMAGFDAPYMEIFRGRRTLTARLDAAQKAAVIPCEGAPAQTPAPPPPAPSKPVVAVAPSAPVLAAAKPAPAPMVVAAPVKAAPPPVVVQPVVAAPKPAPKPAPVTPPAPPLVAALPKPASAPPPLVLKLEPASKPSVPAKSALPVVTVQAPPPIVLPKPVVVTPPPAPVPPAPTLVVSATAVRPPTPALAAVPAPSGPLPALTDGEGVLPARTVIWRTKGANGQPLAVEVTLAPRWEMGRQFVLDWSGKRPGAYVFKPLSGDWASRPEELENKPDLQVSYVAVTVDTGETLYLKRPDRVARSGLAIASSSRVFLPSKSRITKIQLVFGQDAEGVSAVWDFR